MPLKKYQPFARILEGLLINEPPIAKPLRDLIKSIPDKESL